MKISIIIPAYNSERTLVNTIKYIFNSKITETTPGVFCWQEKRAIENVGLYISILNHQINPFN